MAKLISRKLAVLNKVNNARDKALYLVGKQGVGFVKRKTPVETGNLRSSFTFAIKGYPAEPTQETGRKGKHKGRSVRAKLDDCVKEPPESGVLVIGSNVDYVEHVEYGTIKKPGGKWMLHDGILSNVGKLRNTYNKALKGLLKTGGA